jgi:phosphonopyruvate decarboxylase
MTREEAIRMLLAKHGRKAVYVFATGYISRTGYRLCREEGCQAFYMQGSMGMAPAIGLGMALHTEKDVVVVNGDGALLMSMGTTHTLKDYAPVNLFHYVLENGCYESVGGQSCSALLHSYPGVTRIIRVELGDKDERVGVTPPENAAAVARFFAPGANHGQEDQAGK